MNNANRSTANIKSMYLFIITNSIPIYTGYINGEGHATFVVINSAELGSPTLSHLASKGHGNSIPWGRLATQQSHLPLGLT